LIRKFHEATIQKTPEVLIWGSGEPRREFLHVDDLADAALFLMLNYDQEEIINVGVGEDMTIRDLAELIASIVEYQGCLGFDSTKPDGTPRKLLDVSRLNSLGWTHHIKLRDGVDATYEWYKAQQSVRR
jgi:GDP-L-fucose synthase